VKLRNAVVTVFLVSARFKHHSGRKSQSSSNLQLLQNDYPNLDLSLFVCVTVFVLFRGQPIPYQHVPLRY